MPWENGVYKPGRQPLDINQSASSSSGPFYQSAPIDSDQIDDGFFDSTIIASKFSTGSFTATILKQLLPSAVISAANGLRSLFSPGFVNTSLIEDGAVTGAKITNPIKVALINGGSAGVHTVTGIKIGDELISVLEQDGTSGLLTDLTTEFAIVKVDTISNSGGTDTTNDKLLVLYLSK